ncbi:hypothetical protein BDW02DRAFT_597570 [Decorospora gaudefroyi]|uniref:Uncharacterized protein n=1 Tax=Decorospora gaudefroyi TaxID=184978 RepID=A0A6A5KG88_9PLEO|nr:hypothetical protein BDW02DRAFT_597570 [Decorospora gaudefroyi]
MKIEELEEKIEWLEEEVEYWRDLFEAERANHEFTNDEELRESEKESGRLRAKLSNAEKRLQAWHDKKLIKISKEYAAQAKADAAQRAADAEEISNLKEENARLQLQQLHLPVGGPQKDGEGDEGEDEDEDMSAPRKKRKWTTMDAKPNPGYLLPDHFKAREQ